MKTKFIFILLALLFSLNVAAQIGTISGTVSDFTNNESLIGATVVIKGTAQGAATDLDGKFSIKGVKAGTYVIDISYISYKTKTIEKVVVIADKTTQLNVALESDNRVLQAVEIVATRKTGTEMAVITELKKADVVAVGVSSAQIAKTQDRDASQVIKRIPGVSIQDDRFVLVRGLSERYNTVLLNDAITPSIEVDKKSFSFDLVPSSMIDRMLIFKSGTADLPGEFAGGVIRIYTKSIPDEDFVSVSLSTGVRSGTTFKNFTSNTSGGTEALGFDNGDRKLPTSFPKRVSTSTDPELVKQLPNNWSNTTKMALPDLRANVSLGKKFTLAKMQASNLTSINYSNTRTAYTPTRNRYNQFDAAEGKSLKQFEYNDQFNSNEVRIGILSNFNVVVNNKTRLDFRNLFSQQGANETTLRNGFDYASGNELQNYAYRYEQRSIYSGQLSGTHNTSDRDELKWTAGYNRTHREEPDFRRARSSRQIGSTEDFQVIVPPGATTFDAARFYSNLDENAVLANGSWEHKLGDLVDGERSQSKFKVGFYTEKKSRTSSARWMSYSIASLDNFNYDLLKLPIDQIFAEQNIGKTGFGLSEGTNPSDFYKGDNLLAAAYASLSFNLAPKLFAVAGFRGEYNRQQLATSRFGGEPVTVDFPIFSPLPSLNLTYNLSDKQLFRFAYAYTVNRPEFRELAPFSYYDFNLDVNIKGNPNLKTPKIHNVDLRWELYPNPTELLTFGVFYKEFINPIEVFIVSAGSGVNFESGNALKAQSYGAELEARKSLEDVFENKFLQKITVLANVSLIKSKVTFDELAAQTQDRNRPLLGQSPYLVNAGLYYSNNEKGVQVNLLYNVFGKRIFTVGNSVNPTQYEMPRNVVDLNFTKKLGENFELKGGINDILNQKTRVIQDSNLDSKITGVDESIFNYRKGTYTTLGITYKF